MAMSVSELVTTTDEELAEKGSAFDHFRYQVLKALDKYVKEAEEVEDPDVQNSFDLEARFEDFVLWVAVTKAIQ